VTTTRKVIIGVIAVAVAGGGFIAGVVYSKKGVVTVQSGRVTRGDLTATVTASGEIKPELHQHRRNAIGDITAIRSRKATRQERPVACQDRGHSAGGRRGRSEGDPQLGRGRRQRKRIRLKAADSDIDFLVDLDQGRGLLDLGALLSELQDLWASAWTSWSPAASIHIFENAFWLRLHPLDPHAAKDDWSGKWPSETCPCC